VEKIAKLSPRQQKAALHALINKMDPDTKESCTAQISSQDQESNYALASKDGRPMEARLTSSKLLRR
jgi:hypothetical protein